MVQTFFVGNVDEDGRRLVKCAFDCLSAAVAMVRPDTMYRDVGNTITKVRPFPPITNQMTSLRGHRCTCRFCVHVQRRHMREHRRQAPLTQWGERHCAPSDCPLVIDLLAAFVVNLLAASAIDLLAAL